MDDKPVIILEHVDILQGDVPVLLDVNFEVDSGEFTYLIGRTGSGKTSLMKALYSEIKITDGHAFISKYDLRKIKRRQIPYLRRKLGIVFQDFQLLTDRNVMDNLLFVLKSTGWNNKQTMKQRCTEVLEKVGLSTKDYKMPHQLSGGEQQRLVIARALLNNPEVILADEPTGNLDPEVSDGIMLLLQAICKEGTAVIMATHDYRLIQKFPGRILRIANQKVEQVDDVAA